MSSIFFTVHNRGGPQSNNGRGWVWQLVGTSGLPSWLVALVCIKTFFIQTKHSSPKTPFSVLISCRLQRVHNTTAKTTVEVQCYFWALPLQRRWPTLKYWQSRAAVYPNPYKLCKRYPHMPTTSVPQERVFSKAGEVVSKKIRLKPNCAERVLFLKKNL